MSRKSAHLSREKIAATAFAIADADGFQAVSMRRVAQDLGVGTMSLYYYVKTKDDLVALMDDALMGEIVLRSLPEGWKRAIAAIATQTRAVFLRHPWALVSMSSAPPGPNAMRHMEQCLQALAETSMTPKQKFTLLALVDDFVFGHALREAFTPIEPRAATAQLDIAAFPHLAEIFETAQTCVGIDRFQEGLRLLLRDAPPPHE